MNYQNNESHIDEKNEKASRRLLYLGIFFLLVAGFCIVRYYQRNVPITKATIEKKELEQETEELFEEDVDFEDVYDKLEKQQEEANDDTFDDSVQSEAYDEKEAKVSNLVYTVADKASEKSNALQTASKKKSKKNEKIILGQISFPKLGKKSTSTIVEGTGRWDIASAIGHFKGTAFPGRKGNCALCGHNGGIQGTFFKHIHKLKKGDKVKIKVSKKKIITYKVMKKFVCEKNDWTYIEGDAMYDRQLTLMTCCQNGKKRLFVICKQVSK